MTGEHGAARVWRVRWWVRLLTVLLPLALAPFLLVPSLMPNPDWQQHGMPAEEWVWVGVFYLLLGLAAWSAFRARLELADGRVRVVNPWGTREFAVAEVAEVREGSRGVEFVLTSGQVVAAFAVQCTAVHRGPEPRWVEVARAVSP
ncbi:PH domain-containing protein [Crossiella cryophila]|uniref:Low molecular weight protein antigen 6 PH domain-containing protein n=1 Tax=Crossiella cryophila TaxID=43355 RepID=A0A7W7FUT0_9PSEU|nr:PH domain-containing protein [Crossiella cryophila]MBB4678335.1 hypothetical protein [Crossiella cryophila]